MKATIKDGVLHLEIELANKPYVSNTEQRKAEKEGRPATAKALGSTGGFFPVQGTVNGMACKVSANIIVA